VTIVHWRFLDPLVAACYAVSDSMAVRIVTSSHSTHMFIRRCVRRHFQLRCVAAVCATPGSSRALTPSQSASLLERRIDPPFTPILEWKPAATQVTAAPQSTTTDEEVMVTYRCAGCDALLFHEEDRDVELSARSGWTSFERPAEGDSLRIDEAPEVPVEESTAKSAASAPPLARLPPPATVGSGAPAALTQALQRRLAAAQKSAASKQNGRIADGVVDTAPPGEKSSSHSFRFSADVINSPHAAPSMTLRELREEATFAPARKAFRYAGSRLRKTERARKYLTDNQIASWRARIEPLRKATHDRPLYNSVVRYASCACCGGFIARIVPGAHATADAAYAVNSNSVVRCREMVRGMAENPERP
jgi:hypothetical protein